MLATFAALASGSGGEQTMGAIAKGISEALITTETGLVVALPGLFLQYHLSRKKRGFEVFLDHANALGADPTRPARRPLGFAPDPLDEIEWATGRLHQDDLRAFAAFGAFLASQSPTTDQGVTTA
jgi:hypothetical protein